MNKSSLYDYLSSTRRNLADKENKLSRGNLSMNRAVVDHRFAGNSVSHREFCREITNSTNMHQFKSFMKQFSSYNNNMQKPGSKQGLHE